MDTFLMTVMVAIYLPCGGNPPSFGGPIDVFVLGKTIFLQLKISAWNIDGLSQFGNYIKRPTTRIYCLFISFVSGNVADGANATDFALHSAG